MLEFLRRGVKSWVAKVLILLLIGSFAIWGIGDIFSFRLDSAVATVGETEVTAQSFADRMISQRNQLTQQTGQLVSYQDMRAIGFDRQVLNGLIRDAALQEEMNRLGISAPDAAVAQAIRSNPSFEGPSGGFSTQSYAFLLSQQGLTPAQFEELTRTLLAQQIVLGAAQTGVTPPPGLAVQLADWRGEQRDVALMRLTPDLVPEPATPDDAALTAYYEANPAEFTRPERRYGDYLHIDLEKLITDAIPAEDVIRAAYEERIDEFTSAPTRTLDQISFDDPAAAEAAVQRLRSGEIDFVALAAEFGIPEGDLPLGTVTPDDLPEAVAEAVFAITEPGIVGPVEAPLGTVVLNVTELTTAGSTDFEDVRDLIGRQLAEAEAFERAPELANLIDERRAEGATLAEIGSASGAVYGRIEGLAEDGSLADGSENAFLTRPGVLNEVFTALDVEERDLVDTPEGGYFVVFIERIEPSHLPPFDEIRDEVAAAWTENARLEALGAYAAGLADRLNQGELIFAIAAETGVRIDNTGAFTRLTPPEGISEVMVESLFSAEPGQAVTGRSSDDSAVYLARVETVMPLEPAAMEAQSGQLEQILTNSLTLDQQEYLVRAIVERYPVVIDEEAIGRVHELLATQHN